MSTDQPDTRPEYRPGRPDFEQQRTIERRRGNVELLLINGASQRQIADIEGVARSTIQADIKAIRRRWREEGAGGADLGEHRELELRRLEQQRSQLAKAAAEGSPEVHRVLVQIARRTAALLGLDAPKRIYLAGDGSEPGEGVSTPTLVEMLTSYGERSAN